MIRIAAALLAYIIVAHYGYYLWTDDGISRQTAFYVLGAAARVVLTVVIAWVGTDTAGRPGLALVFAGTWGAVEELQVAGCGALRWGLAGAGDLCKRI